LAVRPILLALVVVTACHRGNDPALPTSVASDTSIRAPDGSGVPAGELGRSILRGHALLAATHDSLPTHVGAALNCTSCHLGDGRQKNALPLTGVYARFPQYRSRTGTVQLIEDRINDCFLRSMNGSALSLDDAAMHEIVAYLAFISHGTGVGMPEAVAPAEPAIGDTMAGGQVFRAQCARCHGSDGAGTAPYPPLWGKTSFNIGAGMARLRTAAEFIRHNMPQDRPGTLNDLDAINVAAYILSRPRPDFAGKEHDWPRGDAPDDSPYPTLAGKRPPQ
jgi:thiosulfate dehydrogenase